MVLELLEYLLELKKLLHCFDCSVLLLSQDLDIYSSTGSSSYCSKDSSDCPSDLLTSDSHKILDSVEYVVFVLSSDNSDDLDRDDSEDR